MKLIYNLDLKTKKLFLIYCKVFEGIYRGTTYFLSL